MLNVTVGDAKNIDGIMNELRLPTPLALAKTNLTDPSPFCRHLMLLTESSAALRLLFECGLLRREQTVVLVGSQFPRDANSELRMVRQINEVKRAMQNGQTVVLVNHEGIFPSLYDVLNMRYTTKRSSDTGKVTRMLRLAVGNRSQWCSVGDGFKIVVVVEAKDAYERLDLPLLNRFEKQVLRAADVLEDEASRCLLEDLKTWVKVVEERSQVKDPFVGMYPQTLASLVHCVRLAKPSKELGNEDDSMQTVQSELSRLLSPLAKIRVAEDEVLGIGQSPQKDSTSSLSVALFDEIGACLKAKKHLLVLTFSSSHDFDLLLRRLDDDDKKRFADPIVLGGVTSEKEFIQALKRGSSAKIVRSEHHPPGDD